MMPDTFDVMTAAPGREDAAEAADIGAGWRAWRRAMLRAPWPQGRQREITAACQALCRALDAYGTLLNRPAVTVSAFAELARQENLAAAARDVRERTAELIAVLPAAGQEESK